MSGCEKYIQREYFKENILICIRRKNDHYHKIIHKKLFSQQQSQEQCISTTCKLFNP